MSSKFTGFSEEDLKRIKSGETGANSGPQISTSNIKKLDKIGAKPKRVVSQYKLPTLQKQDSDDAMHNMFDKCKLSIKTPTSPPEDIINNNENFLSDNEQIDIMDTINPPNNVKEKSNAGEDNTTVLENSTMVVENGTTVVENRKNSSDVPPDIVKSVDNYTEDDLTSHRMKLVELQLQQKIMEEQNKKRKEMLSKALADRTKQTEEEVMKLEKIKKELQVLDGQFSLDVAVLRKKIDQACLSYAEAEKNYLKVEKEFLQAKIHFQKEKEKKELLTEHLCALITHNETRKAQKLETLMYELANDRKSSTNDVLSIDDDDRSVIVDGVDQKTGKIVAFTES